MIIYTGENGEYQVIAEASQLLPEDYSTSNAATSADMLDSSDTSAADVSKTGKAQKEGSGGDKGKRTCRAPCTAFLLHYNHLLLVSNYHPTFFFPSI